MLPEYLDAWKKEGIDLDAIYSGFLGSAEQVGSIKRLYKEYPQALRIVDPVMGDGGSKYPTYTDAMCEATRGLIDGADLLMPNLTEASILTGLPYAGQNISIEDVKHIANALLELGAKTVVIKGIVRNDGKIRNYVAGHEIKGEEVASELLPYMIHGTGDLYASALLAAVMCGRSLHDAVSFAGNFVVHAMKVTKSQPDFEVRGVSFESVLGDITSLLNS
jgi:pyridoxine kinase